MLPELNKQGKNWAFLTRYLFWFALDLSNMFMCFIANDKMLRR